MTNGMRPMKGTTDRGERAVAVPEKGSVMKRGFVLTLMTALIVTGCAVSAPPKPAVYAYPAKGQAPEQQSRDSAACQRWAKEQSGYDPTVDAAKGAGIGALIGALGGAASGAAIGAATGGAGTGAAIGTVVGGLGGAAVGGTYKYSKSKAGYEQAFGACMTARGYSLG